MGAPWSSPALCRLMKSWTKIWTEDTGRWRSSPRTRWGTSLGPRSKGKSSWRAAFCSLSASFNRARLGLGFPHFGGVVGKKRRVVNLKAFIELGEVKSRINRDRRGFCGVPVWVRLGDAWKKETGENLLTCGPRLSAKQREREERRQRSGARPVGPRAGDWARGERGLGWLGFFSLFFFFIFLLCFLFYFIFQSLFQIEFWWQLTSIPKSHNTK